MFCTGRGDLPSGLICCDQAYTFSSLTLCIPPTATPPLKWQEGEILCHYQALSLRSIHSKGASDLPLDRKCPRIGVAWDDRGLLPGFALIDSCARNVKSQANLVTITWVHIPLSPWICTTDHLPGDSGCWTVHKTEGKSQITCLGQFSCLSQLCLLVIQLCV